MVVLLQVKLEERYSFPYNSTAGRSPKEEINEHVIELNTDGTLVVDLQPPVGSEVRLLLRLSEEKKLTLQRVEVWAYYDRKGDNQFDKLKPERYQSMNAMQISMQASKSPTDSYLQVSFSGLLHQKPNKKFIILISLVG